MGALANFLKKYAAELGPMAKKGMAGAAELREKYPQTTAGGLGVITGAAGHSVLGGGDDEEDPDEMKKRALEMELARMGLR